jgi:PAS domain S-box-containing protein
MIKDISVLIVDDDEDDFILLKSFFEEIKKFNFNLQWTPDYSSGLSLMKLNKHHIIIIDYLLGARTGLELLQNAIKDGCKVPVIVLTGQGSYNIDVAAMELGATDFLVKSELNHEKLERSIRYALERYENLLALRESEEKYRTIFESSRDMIYITDEEGNFIDVNQSATRIFGYSKEEFQKLSASVLYFKAAERETFLNEIKKTGVISNYEVALRDKTGNKKDCLVSASIQPSPDGRLFIFGVVNDITHRKKIERDLVTAEKLAITGRLTQMLAHEVRNPLTSINLTVEQLEFELEDKKYDSYLNIIKRNCKRISDLIMELLYASKAPEVKMSKYSVNKLIEETLELCVDRIKMKKIEIRKHFSPDLCEVTLDKSKIKTALLNLLVNAIEAVAQEGGVITIKTWEENGKCYIEVEDNGTGIPQTHIEKIFEPYFTAKEGGVGLGLATVHKIIQSHSGTIEVESEVNKGTKFAIALSL